MPCRLVALVLAVAPWVAGAEMNGLRVGEGRLHPHLEVESRYDSLVGWVGELKPASDFSTLTAYGDLGMHYRPGFVLEVPSEAVALSLSATVDVVQYMGMENPGTTAQNWVGAEAGGSAIFNPKGNISFGVEDTFRRSDRTSMLVLAVGTITDYNLARLRLGIRPGSGALLIEPGYSMAFEHFEWETGAISADCTRGDPTCDPQAVSALDYQMHTVHLDATWKFLPKTSFVLESSLGVRKWIGEQETNDGTVLTYDRFDTKNLKVLAGLTGLITDKLTLTVKGGWGDQLGKAGFKSVIGQVEAGFQPSEQLELKAGYLRTFEPLLGPSLAYTDDRVHASLRTAFGERLALLGEVSYDTIGFDRNRTDHLLRLSVAPSYVITRWLSASVGLARTGRDSSLTDAEMVDYTRLEYYARLRASY